MRMNLRMSLSRSGLDSTIFSIFSSIALAVASSPLMNALRSWRRVSSSPASRRMIWRGLLAMPSTSRACSHWPVKLRARFSERGSLSMRSICAGRFWRNSPRAASCISRVIGHGRPQEVRHARGERVFVHLGDRGAGRVPRRLLELEQEARAREHRGHGMRHALFEALALLRVRGFGECWRAAAPCRRRAGGDRRARRRRRAVPPHTRGGRRALPCHSQRALRAGNTFRSPWWPPTGRIPADLR